jgi:hypothetical protein
MPAAHQKMECKPRTDIYNLQQQWLLACADFDAAKGKGPKQRAAVTKMQRVLRLMQGAHPREVAPYRQAYEKRLEKMAGVKLPRVEVFKRTHDAGTVKRKKVASKKRH